MLNNGYERTICDNCVFVKKYDDDFIILLLYVDNILIVGSKIDRLKKELIKFFAMKY